NIISTTRE
ncbi:hypothetical protein ACMD2_22351, partial [Ananas comosus]